MGDLFSLFWEADQPPKPLTFYLPDQENECQKDDSCGTIGSFLLWYFIIIFVLMFFSRTSAWMSEKSQRGEDSGTSTSVSKDSNEASFKPHSKNVVWDSLKAMKKGKHIQLTPVTGSEVALVNAYLERRRARCHPQFDQSDQLPTGSDTTDGDSEDTNSGSSSWKESAREHQPSPASVKRRTVQRRKGSHSTREKACLHCKALRTNEWLARHFLTDSSATTPKKGGMPEETSIVDISTKFSKI
ncbi:serine-rich single-pass membrane protein 1 [Echinops telfairi]|uniref:Serine-rich single-pass membrane protein 1 n=1 Tax=Echinops telfairi TaxID=9371 RepID=A0ABM0IUC4_ECHTE|nr:serine-rich single-pass membrane protein 1 [Echinops telfairi]